MATYYTNINRLPFRIVLRLFFFLSSALSFLEEINHSTFLEELSDCIKWLLATVQEENSKRKSL